MSQGQLVAGLMAALGAALLLLAMMREARIGPAHLKARLWSSLVGVRSSLVDKLLMAAGFALLLAQRLDRDALPRVLTNVKTAMWSAAAAKRSRR